jgi:hypothetical protein
MWRGDIQNITRFSHMILWAKMIEGARGKGQGKILMH